MRALRSAVVTFLASMPFLAVSPMVQAAGSGDVIAFPQVTAGASERGPSQLRAFLSSVVGEYKIPGAWAKTYIIAHVPADYSSALGRWGERLILFEPGALHSLSEIPLSGLNQGPIALFRGVETYNVVLLEGVLNFEETIVKPGRRTVIHITLKLTPEQNVRFERSVTYQRKRFNFFGAWVDDATLKSYSESFEFVRLNPSAEVVDLMTERCSRGLTGKK